MGREVADAYIEVHGDLSPFRKDLEKANASMEELAIANADKFSDAWGKRMSSGIDRQWASLVDNMYSQQPLDLNRMMTDFDSSDLDELSANVQELMDKMEEGGKLTSKQYKDVKKRIDESIKSQQQAFFEEQDMAARRAKQEEAHKQMIADISEGLKNQGERRKETAKAWERANDDLVKQFKEVRKAYDESFDGMFKTELSKRMADDLKSMVTSMADADWTKFARSFDSLDGMRERISEVNKAMFESGRISMENYNRITEASNAWIEVEKRRQEEIIETARVSATASEEEKRLQGEALDAARKAREEQERWKASLEGMVEKATIRKLENDFNLLADAIARGDWSKISKGFKDLESMRAEVIRISEEMRTAGRLSDDMMDGIIVDLDHMRLNADAYRVSFNRANAEADEHGGLLERNGLLMRALASGAESLSGKLAAMVGFNVIMDSLRTGSEFMSNMDRHAVSFMKSFSLGGAVVGGVVSALGGITTVLSDVGRTAAGIGLFAPAFMSGLAIGVGVLVASFKDMKTVLADLGPSYSKLQDAISAEFWKKAAQPIRELSNTLMPILNQKLTITGELMGNLFAKFANVLKDDLAAGRLEMMFDRLNEAMAISEGMVEPLTRAFLVLGDWGSKYFTRFATWLVDISEQFDKFIETAASNGDLDRWMEETITGLKNLWGIAAAGVGIFNSINDAATMAGSKGLQGFRDAMDKIAEVMSSQRFIAAMTQVFRGAFDAMEGFKKGFLDLGPAIEAFLPTYSSIMSKFSGIFEAAFGVIGGFLLNKDFQRGLDDFVGGISKAFQNMLPAIQPMATSLGGVFSLMGDILDVGSRLLSKVFVKLGPEFDKVVTAIKPLVGPIEGLGSSLIDALAAVLKTLAEKILPPVVRLLGELIPVLTETLKQITPESLERWKMLGDTIDFMADSVKNLKEALAPLRAGGDLEWLGDLLFSGGGPGGNTGGGGNPIEDAFTNLINGIDWDWLGNAIVDGWNRIWSGNIFGDQPGKFFREADENMNQWWDDTIGSWWDDTIGPWFDGIKGMMEDAWNGFTDFLDGLFGGGRNDGGDKGSAGGRSIGSAIGLQDLEDPSKWEEFGAKIRDSVTTFFTGIGAWVTESSAALKTGWDEFWGGFGEKVNEVWTGIVEWITTKYTEVSTGLTTWWTGLQAGWTGFWDAVGLKVSETWNAMVTWIVTKYTEIQTNITNFITTARTNWDNFWRSVGETVTITWTAMRAWIDGKVAEIRGGIDGFITTVRGNWTNFWSGIGQTVSQIWGQMTGAIAGYIGGIIGSVSGFIGTVRGIWDGGWQGIVSALQTAWNNMTSAVSSGVESVVGFVSGLPGRILGIIQGINLSGAGAAIMGSFLGGLQSSWGAVTDFVGGIAGWIAANKGPIELDRKLLIPAGMAIMGSLVSGLKGGMGGLENQVNAVTSTIIDGMTEGLSRSAMYVAGMDAAMGLADGLASKKATVEDVFKSLLPDTSDLRVSAQSASGGEPPAAAGTIINVEAGAIPITTPTKDPEIVASKVIDGFANFSNL